MVCGFGTVKVLERTVVCPFLTSNLCVIILVTEGARKTDSRGVATVLFRKELYPIGRNGLRFCERRDNRPEPGGIKAFRNDNNTPMAVEIPPQP